MLSHYYFVVNFIAHCDFIGMVDKVHVRILNVVEIGDEKFRYVLERIRLLGMSATVQMDPPVYKRYVLGRWLTLMTLKSYGIPERELANIKVADYGKPYIPGQRVSFNVSHSGNLVVCASSLNCNIGIDIEVLRSIAWGEYEECFQPAERKDIRASANPSFEMLQRWTKKESLLKADGRGLQVAMSAVEIRGDRGRITNENQTWHLREVPLAGYTCHVCTEFPLRDVVVESGM